MALWFGPVRAKTSDNLPSFHLISNPSRQPSSVFAGLVKFLVDSHTNCIKCLLTTPLMFSSEHNFLFFPHMDGLRIFQLFNS